MPHAARTVPTTHIRRESPMLPEERKMDPGVAKMPLPMTREMTRMYALAGVRMVLGPCWMGFNNGCRSI